MSVRLRFFSFIRFLLYASGSAFLLMAVLAFTRLPFDLHRWLGTGGADLDFTPEYILMPGGSGMPSESNLMRLYYTRELAMHYPLAPVIILHPSDTSVAFAMKQFLVQNGLDAPRIFWISKGTNTREQFMELVDEDPGIAGKRVAVVTSPEHMYRTLGVLRKLGFTQAGGVPAFDQAMFVDLGYDHSKVGGKWYAPDVSSNLNLRYNFWNYLKLQITCYRELLAIAYYRLNGWM